jgi:hypothetical protein
VIPASGLRALQPVFRSGVAARRITFFYDCGTKLPGPPVRARWGLNEVRMIKAEFG